MFSGTCKILMQISYLLLNNVTEVKTALFFRHFFLLLIFTNIQKLDGWILLKVEVFIGAVVTHTTHTFA